MRSVFSTGLILCIMLSSISVGATEIEYDVWTLDDYAIEVLPLDEEIETSLEVESETETEEETDESNTEVPDTSGTCGKNVNWILNEDGILTIYGEGDIESNAFYGNMDIVTVVIEEGVTSIGNSAFNQCMNLKTVIMPESVIRIGHQVFWECMNLTNFIIPSSVTTIEYGAFYGCSSLTHMIIPNSVLEIGDRAFAECKSLVNIELSENMSIIENYMFENCSNLVSLTIPENITKIGERAFYGCDSLLSIQLSKNITNIGDNAFVKCKNLKELYVAEENKKYSSIEGVLFNKNQTKLITYPIGRETPNYIIPSSVIEIESNAFVGCDYLISVEIPSNVTSIGGCAFEQCDNLVQVILSEGIRKIGVSAFSGCEKLGNITIPSSVTKIEYGVFSNCSSLTNITIPSSIISIKDNAFGNCINLKEIYFEGEAPFIQKKSGNVEEELQGGFYVGSFHNIIAIANYPFQSDGWETIIGNGYGGTITWMAQGIPFTDVSATGYYCPIVGKMYALRLMTGLNEFTFAPEKSMTRGMVVTVLYRMADEPDIPYETLFVDVAEGKYYTKSVMWAAKNDVVKGFKEDNTFRPGMNITREQMAVILYNYAKSLNLDISQTKDLSNFNDGDKVATYAKPAMSWATGCGILSGTKEGNLEPKKDANRAECAKMLLQMYKLIKEDIE